MGNGVVTLEFFGKKRRSKKEETAMKIKIEKKKVDEGN